MVGVSFTQKYLQGPPQSAAQNPLADAEKAYPKLRGLGIAKTTTPIEGDQRKLEFWPADEPGDQQFPRPKDLPMGKPGVQIIDPATTSEDVAGDIVSHHLVKQDPAMKSLYAQFTKTFDDPKVKARLVEDYNWSRKNEGEKRPFNDWLQATRIPDYLRGYVFNQWPQKAKEQMYTPEQRKILDRMSGYLKGKQ